MKRVAILGASGYIGRSLVHEFLSSSMPNQLFLFSRSKDKLLSLGVFGMEEGGRTTLHDLSELDAGIYEVIINCTGLTGDISLYESPHLVFEATESVDVRIIEYLRRHRETLYINISSGAVFGMQHTEAVQDSTMSIFPVNGLQLADFYGIAKLNAEARHRSHADLRIVDLRVFSFFSRFVDSASSFLMSELIQSLRNQSTFRTDDLNIVRDYVTPKDLFQLISLTMERESHNEFYDVYSKQSVSKFALLDFLKQRYGLRYVIDAAERRGGGLSKSLYFSENRKAESIGYLPEFSSLEGIEHEISHMPGLGINTP